jgi:hypothetical protein
MLFLFEEILVEAGAIIATLVAAGLLIAVLLGFVVERRALRRRATARYTAVRAQDARGAEHSARPWPTFTTSRN